MSRKGKYRGKKRKGRVVIKQQVTLAHKNDATRVAIRDTTCATQLKKAPFIMNDNGINMRIKIKRKSR